MKKENMKKQYRSSGATVQSLPLLSGTQPKQSPSGLTRGSIENIALLFELDSRVKPENDNAGKEIATTGLGEDIMKRIFATTVLTLCSVFLFSSMANAACSPVDCAALGYTKTEAVCNGSSTIRCPFDVSKVNCVEKALNCSVGDNYYSDGTCDASVITGKTPVGVVGYVTDGGKHGLAIALEETSVYWSTPGYGNLSCLPDLNNGDGPMDMKGKNNTACIMSQTNDTYPAASYCNSYKPVSSGKGSTEWYLPAAGELRIINPYFNELNTSLQRLAKTQLSYEYYWSSSEFAYSNYAWYVRLNGGFYGNHAFKYTNYRVRCMLEF